MSARPETPIQETARLIRAHLWQPRQPDSPDSKPWTMGRELSVYKRLRKGFKHDDIAGAISVVRDIRSDWAGVPLRMTIFYASKRDDDGSIIWCSTPFMEQAIHFHHEREASSKSWDKWGMSPIKIDVRSKR